MRYIIGIIAGIVIVLNWGSVKELFDSKLTQQEAAAPVAAPPPPPPPPPATEPEDIVSNHMAKAAADQ